MRWPKSHNRYLDEFFRLTCAPDLLRWKLFPNIKEVTESFSAYEAVRSNFGREFPLGDPGITMVAVGDGYTPRTAATFATRTAWRCISVDPRLRCQWSTDPRTHQWSEIQRLELHRTVIERADLRVSGRVIIVAVHSHAKLPDAVRACAGAERLAAVAIPCCVPQVLSDAPSREYADPSNLSPQRTVRIWADLARNPSDRPPKAIPEVITMSEICEICGRAATQCEVLLAEKAGLSGLDVHSRLECMTAAYERTLARADRYQAEFAACKALLIAAQQRAEKAEAERAAAEARAKEAEERADMNGDLHGIALEAEVAAEQRASEARAALEALLEAKNPDSLATARRALAALPVEPARVNACQVKLRNEEDAAHFEDILRAAARHLRDMPPGPQPNSPVGERADTERGRSSGGAPSRSPAEPARCSDQPAPQNEPPSPTGDAE